MTCYYDKIFLGKTRYRTTQSVLLSGHSCLHFHLRTYKAQLMGAANVIEQHLTKTPCSATIDTNLQMGSCIPQENPNHIIAWKDHHHKRQEMNTLGIHKIQQQGSFILIPSLHAGEAIQKKFGPTRGIVQLDRCLAIRHVEVIKNSLQGLLDIVTKYAKTGSDDVVAPMLEAHIVQPLFLQKQIMARKWERLCFLQEKITQLQKWMVSGFPSTAARSSTNDWVLKWKQFAIH